MKWAEMTAEQRNRLIAEKVMDYETGILPNGKMVMWNAEFLYSKLYSDIPPYTQSLDAAWLVVRYMNQPQDSVYERYARFIEEIKRLLESDMLFDLFYCDKNEDHLTPERICLAALKAVESEDTHGTL